MVNIQANNLKEIKKFATSGCANAQYVLGVIYAKGHGVAANYYKAVYWMKQAARLDHAQAQFELSAFLLLGIGTPLDRSTAFYWMGRAARCGCVPAITLCGILQLFGFGMPQNARMGLIYLHEAVRRNDSYAAMVLNSVRGIPVDMIPNGKETEEKFFSELSNIAKLYATTSNFYPSMANPVSAQNVASAS